MIANILITDQESMDRMHLEGSDTVQKMSFIFLSNGDGTFEVYKDRWDTFTKNVWSEEKQRMITVKKTKIPFADVMNFVQLLTATEYSIF